MPLLSVSNLSVSVAGRPIVHGVNLEIKEGELHAIMGPNGSGKSTLVNALMGHPAYEITGGAVEFQDNDLLKMKPHERALSGLFLAFQYPKEIAGVTLRSFLYAAYNAKYSARKQQKPKNKQRPLPAKLSPIKFKKHLEGVMKELNIDESFAERHVNKGFSGGEKKKAEILQMKILNPALALLDETDSGLDIDALKIVASGINSMRTNQRINESTNQRFSALLVTHYARILEFVHPNRVHVMVGGRIVESGGADLASQLEKRGYGSYLSMQI